MLKSGARLKRTAGPKRRKRLRPVSRKAISDRNLDDLCRTIVRARDGGICQRCGSTVRKLEWCHVVNRQAKSIQWTPWNSLMLCGPRKYSWSCHYWFDSNKDTSMDWWRGKWPERALALDFWRHNGKHEIDRPGAVGLRSCVARSSPGNALHLARWARRPVAAPARGKESAC